MEIDVTPSSLIISALAGISSDMTPGGDRVTALDGKQAEDIDEDVELFTAIGTKMNPRKWVKKRESQIGQHLHRVTECKKEERS